MNTNTCPVQIHVSEQARRALRHLAIESGTTVAALVREAIRTQLPEVGQHFDARASTTSAAPAR